MERAYGLEGVKVHAIKTGTVEIKRREREGNGRRGTRLLSTALDRSWVGPLPIYAWAIEHPEGLILVDTGETYLASETGYFPRWHPYFRLAVRERVERDEEIDRKLESRGLAAADVRWVILTHLHTDHCGGLHHFRHSEVLVTAPELRAAAGRAGRMRGYVNRRFPAWFDPRPIELEPSPKGPFTRSRPVTSDGRVRIVATPGHTPGHASVVVEGDNATLLLAGDASYSEELLQGGVAGAAAWNPRAARASLATIRAYCLDSGAIYLPSHDPASGRRLRDLDSVAAPAGAHADSAPVSLAERRRSASVRPWPRPSSSWRSAGGPSK